MHQDLKKMSRWGGKGRVPLSTFSGKWMGEDLPKSSVSNLQEGSWASLCEKPPMEGRESTSEDTESHSNCLTLGLHAVSDCHLRLKRFGSSGLPSGDVRQRGSLARRVQTPSRSYKGRAFAQQTRYMQALPRPVSSLESCLRAQLIHELDSKKEPLDFSSLVEGSGQFSSTCENGNIPLYTFEKIFSLDIDHCSDGPVDTNGICKRVFKDDKTSSTEGMVAVPEFQQFFGRANSLKMGFSSSETAGTLSSNDKRTYTESEAEKSFPASVGIREVSWKKSLLPFTLKKRKISRTCQILSTSSDSGVDSAASTDEATTPMEALLFSFGVGIGVMCTVKSSQCEIDRLNQLLKAAEAQVQILKEEVDKKDAEKPSQEIGTQSQLSTCGGVEEELDDFESLRIVQADEASSVEGGEMADLEAELEAELDHLTGQYSDLDELEMDGVAALVHGDLNAVGLPAQLDSYGDDSSASEVACINSDAVSPRELTRLLLKLQSARQEEHISDLEADLEAAMLQLKEKEKELEHWKKHVCQLTELSISSPTSGQENFPIHCQSSAVVTPFERSSSGSGSEPEISASIQGPTLLDHRESFHLPLQSSGSSVDWPAGCFVETKGLNPGHLEKCELMPARGGGLEEMTTGLLEQGENPGLDRRLNFDNALKNSSAKDDVRDEFLQALVGGELELPPRNEQALQTAMDCKLIFEDSQIQQLLVDSIQDLRSWKPGDMSDMGSNIPSINDYSSTVSMSDGWESGFDPSMRGHFHEGHGVQKFMTKPESSVIAKCARLSASSISVSEISDGEAPDYCASGTTLCSSNIETITRPVGPFNHDVDPFFWNREGGLGRAGANTPDDSGFTMMEPISNMYTRGPMISLGVQQPHILDGRGEELNPTVYEKVVGWEGLIRQEPFAAMGSDWECQSQASEYEQRDAQDPRFVEGGSLHPENLVSDSEEHLGNKFKTEIVGKTRHGSDIVPEVQTIPAMLEMDNVKVRNRSSREQDAGSVEGVASFPSLVGSTLEGIAGESGESFEFLWSTLPKHLETMRVSEIMNDKDSQDITCSQRADTESITVFNQAASSQSSQGADTVVSSGVEREVHEKERFILLFC